MSARFFCWDAGESAVAGGRKPSRKTENKESFGQAFTKACGVRGEALPQEKSIAFYGE